jgi:hypothetical protein
MCEQVFLVQQDRQSIRTLRLFARPLCVFVCHCGHLSVMLFSVMVLVPRAWVVSRKCGFAKVVSVNGFAAYVVTRAGQEWVICLDDLKPVACQPLENHLERAPVLAPEFLETLAHVFYPAA